MARRDRPARSASGALCAKRQRGTVREAQAGALCAKRRAGTFPIGIGRERPRPGPQLPGMSPFDERLRKAEMSRYPTDRAASASVDVSSSSSSQGSYGLV